MQEGVLPTPTPQSKTLGKYRLIARLGQGGMAEVFLAVVQGDVGFNKLSVVKVLKPELMEEPDHQEMFLEEGRLAARLNHTNIVQTNEVQIVGEQYFIAMEYLDGQPLHRILRRAAKGRPMPLGWHLYFLCEVLAALEYAHDLRDYDGSELQMVHRDVTPHNVFVTYTGQVKLCDFGIAKTLTSSVETRAGVLKGKVNYMAPEQVLTTRVDRRADLFAVGVMLWEAVTGARMWHGQTDILIMQALSQGRIPDAREINPKVDPELEQIVARALAPKPENRYQTAKEMRKDIETYLASRTERLNPRRIGEWVAELFEKERKNLTRVIQQQLSSGGSDGSIAQLAPRVASSGESSPSASAARGFALSAPPPSMSQERVASVSIPSAAVRAFKPNRWLAIGLGAGGALALFTLIIVIVVLANPNEGEVTAVTPTPTVPRVAATPVPADKPQRIEVRVSAQPSDAKIFLDGRALDQNPFVGSFPADGKDHELRIEADGHETVTRRISFARDVMIELSLEKLAGKKTAGAAGPVAPRQPPTKSGEAFPDLEAPKPKTTAKPIDTNDPWK